MIRIVRMLVAALLAAIFGGVLSTSAAVAAPSAPANVYTYDTPSYHAPENYTALKRGPPVTRDASTNYDAVDLRSHGSSARQDGAAAPAAFGYDRPTLFMQVIRTSGTTERLGPILAGDLSSLSTRSVAAKAGPALGPARNTDLVLDSFRKLGPGRNALVRTAGSVDELQDTFNAWTVGAERIASRGPKVPDVYRLPDGGVIQWRTSSGTGGPTIDIFPVSGRQRTVHLADGVPW